MGVVLAGLSTNGQPAAMAGPILCATRLSGKLNGLMNAHGHKEHRWHPHQLCQNAATELRREFGLDAARVILGHRTPTVTEIYAEPDHIKAVDARLRVG